MVMEYEDRLTIATPEGVDLELTLAGVGSRFAAALIDYGIQLAILIALGIVLGVGFGLGPGEGGFAAALFVVLSFLLFVGYDIAFEVLASGRTPGKRMNGTRVVREDGGPVTFPTSAVRNVLRIVDILPGMYLVGIGSILVSSRNQRVGDLAAGTLVVRERKVAPPPLWLPQRPGPAVDTSTLEQFELAAVRSFLARRHQLTADARVQVAAELASKLRPRVGGATADVPDEVFLERIAVARMNLHARGE
jgi:uncharacterized RDD family membrane protein YckC